MKTLLLHGIFGGAWMACLSLTARAQEPELLAYWNFEGNTDDQISKSKGVLNGEAKLTNGGRFGMSLDTSALGDSFVLVEKPAWFNKASARDQVSVSFWQIYTGEVADQNQTLFAFASPSSPRVCSAHTPWGKGDNNLYFDTNGCCNGEQRTNGPSAYDDTADPRWKTWTHFVFIRDKSAKKIYMNGQLIVEGDNPALMQDDLDQDGGELKIGSGLGSFPHAGLIDEFAVWAGAIPESRVKELAAGGSVVSSDKSDPNVDIGSNGVVDFGRLAVLTSDIDLEAKIRNTGNTKALNVSAFKITGADAASFTLGATPTSVPAKGEGVVKLKFNSKGVIKVYNATLEFTSDDPDADDKAVKVALKVTLSGNGDSDSDGLQDQAEVATHKTDPLNPDTDKDGLSDGDEVNTYKSDPTKADTDGDGSGDAAEALFGGNATDANVKLGTFLVRHVLGNTQFGDIDSFKAALDDASQIAEEKAGPYPYINFRDNAQGHFANDELPFPLWSSFGDRDDFGIYATGSIKITKAGVYTFGCNSDDGFQINIDGKTVLEFPQPRGSADTFGSTNLTAGEHKFEIWFYERGGGAQVEVFVNTQLGDVSSFGAGKFILLPAFGEGKADTDNDGLNDFWERRYFNNLNATAAGDPDNDALNNGAEQTAGTNPTKADTDGDGLNDGDEVNGTPKSNPTLADSDSDGLNDKEERTKGTGPTNRDTDGDGISDGLEVIRGSNPLDPKSPGAAVPNNLVASWEFNNAPGAGGVLTSEAGGLKGALNGGAALTADKGGRSGAAGDKALNVLGGSLKVDDGAALAAINDAFGSDTVTVAFWQKLNNVTNQTTFKFQSPSSSGAERGWSVHTTWGDRTIYYDTAGCCAANTQRINKNVGGLDLLAWHHFVFVKNQGTKEIWVDGAKFHSGTGASPLPKDITALWIGSALENSEPTDGVLDDVAIFGKALDETVIKQLAGGTPASKLTGPATAKPSPNLIGYWPADDGAGTQVTNAANPAFHGTLNKGTWSKDAEGHTGKAGDFAFRVDGNDQGTSHVTTPPLGSTFKEITVAGWIKGKPTGEWTGIFQARQGAQPIGIGFRGGSGELTYTWNNNSDNSWNFNSGLAIPEGQWAFVALTVKPNQARLHLGTTGGGGAFKTAVNDIPQLTQENKETGWHFGRDNCCGTARNFEGLMDDISIWDVALTDDELKSLWNGSKTPITVRSASDPGSGQTADAKPKITFSRSAASQGIAFTGASGKTYDVEYSEDLRTWSVVGAGVSGAVNYQDTDAGRRGKRAGFYRARQK